MRKPIYFYDIISDYLKSVFEHLVSVEPEKSYRQYNTVVNELSTLETLLSISGAGQC